MKKLIKENVITPLKKGFYVSPLYRETALITPEETELYWIYLANSLRSPSYVSLEYVLSKYSIIPEIAFAITSITLKSGRIYKPSETTFIYQNIKKELFFGYQQLVFGNSGLTARIAHPYKALFDFLYLKHFTSKEDARDFLIKTGRINWDIISTKNKRNFVDIIRKSQSKKMQMILEILQKEMIL